MGWSCNLFGRVISITSPETLDGGTGRSSGKKKRRKGRRRGGPMDDEEEEGSSSNAVDYRFAPHPAMPPAVYYGQSMARSVFYSNDSPVIIMQAPDAAGYSSAPPTTSYAYAGAPSVVPVVMEQQAPAPSKSRVRFALPGGGGQNNVDEPVVAMPVGTSTGAAEMYYQPPQHDQYHQVVQQHSNGHQQQILRHEETTGHVPAVFGPYQSAPLSFMHPGAATPEYGHYNYSYPTPRREAVYRIGTDTNRFSMFSDENPNACAIS